MDKRRTIQAAIDENAKRLTEMKEGDELSKRVKKRILQKLGKLKKDLAALDAESNSSGNVGKEPDNAAAPVEEDVPALSKEERKLKLRLLNKDLAEFAQKKQLTMAKKRFEQGIRKGLKVDVHSYTNLINAYVRCSDLRGAEQSLQRMQAAGIEPNLVTYTTLLKGYSESGDMEEAARIYFSSMRTTGRGPNVRALNTFLRTCVRTGMVKPALQSYFDFIDHEDRAEDDMVDAPNKKQKVSHGGQSSIAVENDSDFCCDASSYEYLIGLLCRTGHTAIAEHVLAQFTSAHNGSGAKGTAFVSAGGVSAIENAAIYISLASTAALHGHFDQAHKWRALVSDALKRTETATLKESMLKRFQAANGSSKQGGGGSGGTGGDDESRSVALFLKHRRTELEGQLEIIQDYLNHVTRTLQHSNAEGSSAGAATPTEAVKTASLKRSPEGALQAQFTSLCNYLQCLSQVLCFGFDGRCDYDAHVLTGPAATALAAMRGDQLAALNGADINAVQQESALTNVAARLLIGLRDKFGLDGCRLPSLTAQQATDVSLSALHANLKQKLRAIKQSFSTKIFTVVDPQSGFIDFPALFRPVGVQQKETLSNPATDMCDDLPVKLEICSGNGEWVVAQSAADWTAPAAGVGGGTGGDERRPKALWVALELRCDRIQYTLAHYLLSLPPSASVRNLAFLSGNAAHIIPNRVAPESVSEIFINHPQPPDRVTGGGDGGKHQPHHKTGKDKQAEKNQGAHLLTQAFFAELVRILKPNGTITIVTDNQAYGKSLAASIAAMPTQTRTKHAQDGDHAGGEVRAVLVGGVNRYILPAHWDHSLDDSYPVLTLQNSPLSTTTTTSTANSPHKATIDLWRGEAGPEVGHVTAASSYFDRMWDLGQKKRRWFIYVKKVVL